MRKLFVSMILFLAITMIGCQKNNLDFSNDVSKIEVFEWESDTMMTTIDDNEVIDELVKKLNRANTSTTANMDYPLPDLRLIFFNNENEPVFEIGYYHEMMNLGVKGRYLDVEKDTMYQVEIPLNF